MDYIDHLASQAEEAASQGNFKGLYLTTKKLAGKFLQTDMPVQNKDGTPLTTVEELLKQWTEHCRTLHILLRVREAVDPKHRDQQAGFRRNRFVWIKLPA